MNKKIFYYSYQLLLCAILYSILVFLQLKKFADDPGVGWHIMTGEYIAKTYSIPFSDPFLAISRAWISDQWLSDLILYKLDLLAGFPLVYALIIALFIVVFGGFLFSFCIKLGVHPILSIIACIMAIKLASIHFILRPVVVSFFCFTLLYVALSNYHKQDYVATKKQKLFIYLLPLLFMFWANLHPSFIIGLITLGLLVVSIIIDKFLFNKEIGSQITHNTLLLLIACFMATLVNPYLFSLHESILFLGKSKYFMSLHNEWLPINAREEAGKLFFALLFSIFLMIYFVKDTIYKPLTFSFLIFIFFAYMAVDSIRFTPYFGITMAPILGMLISSFFPNLLKGLKIDTEKNLYPNLIPMLFSLFLICYTLIYQNIPLNNYEFGPSKKEYPYLAVDELTKKIPTNTTQTILATPDWGGFLVWRSNLKLKPVLDDRNTLVGEEYHKEIMEALKTPQNAINYAKEKKINYVLLANRELKQTGCSATNFEESTPAEMIVSKDEVGVLIRVAE